MKMVWALRGTHIELCSCAPGCDCNFRGVPNSPEGNCEALLGSVISSGHSDEVDLSDTRVAWALWWPGAIHEKGGRGHAYVDCETDEQFEVLRTIWRGEAGHAYFEIFNSTFDEPTAVDRATIDAVVDGRRSGFSVSGVGVAQMEPLRNPVSGAENNVRIVKPDAFIWKDGAIGQGTRLHVDLPEMSFDLTGRHAVFAEFDWSAG
jgi:hypothetical protein